MEMIFDREKKFRGKKFEGESHVARSGLSLRYKRGVIDQVLRKPYTCIEHDLSDISRQVSLISGDRQNMY